MEIEEIEERDTILYYKYKGIPTSEKNDRERCREIDEEAERIKEASLKRIREVKDEEEIMILNEVIERMYEIRGRRYFEDFLIASEYNFESDSKPYEVRREILKEWVEELEKLEYGELKGLSISAPPRTGKTFLGVKFFEWSMLRHPEKSCFFVSHTTAMATKVYKDVINDFEDERKNIGKIFEEFRVVEKNSEYLYIQLKHHKSNSYHSGYFRGIDGNMSGVLEASWLLYCDDLIKNIEEAMNPDRLENARGKYGIDIRQRKANKGVKELHIATRWSTGDVISTLEKEHEGDREWKFIKRPALDERGRSNFMYRGDAALDEEYFLAQRRSPMMDEISFSCIYQQEPIEREGLLFSESRLKYYNGELPDKEGYVCSACDVAWGRRRLLKYADRGSV